MRKFVLPLLVFLLIVFAQVNFSQTVIEPEEYAVYSSLLNQMFTNEKTNQLVIENLTSADDFQPIQKRKKGLSSLSKEIIEDSITKNTKSYELSDKFNSEANVKLLGGSEREELFKKLNENYYEWGKVFRQKYPAGGVTIISLSRVGFNAEKSQALVFTDYQCGWTCGEGNYVLLTKKEGQWKVKKKSMKWIS